MRLSTKKAIERYSSVGTRRRAEERRNVAVVGGSTTEQAEGTTLNFVAPKMSTFISTGLFKISVEN